jgi:hypothetical protein
MSKLEDLEKGVESLPPEELSKFRAWFVEFDHRAWDKQIEADSRAGKLDKLAAQALGDYKAGKARKL